MLVNGLLGFATMSQKGVVERVPTLLYNIVESVNMLSLPLLGEKKVVLSNKIPRNFPHILVNEDQLNQILHNLIGNSIKFTDIGEIFAYAEVLENCAIISVTDTGIGISSALRDRIFEPFLQSGGDGDWRQKYGGVGLGLAVTKKLVELNQGKIWMESTTGVGSTFTFTLPLAPSAHNCMLPNFRKRKAKELSDCSTSGTTLVKSRKVVLSVDDEPVNQMIVKNFFVKRFFCSSSDERIRCTCNY